MCGKQEGSQSNLIRHQRSVDEGFKYPCLQCGNQFNSQSDQARHKLAVQEGVKYPFV